MTNAKNDPNRRDQNSNPPRVSDTEDERWVGEGGSMEPSAHGAGNDGRDKLNQSAADNIDKDDPHKVEKLAKLGHAGEEAAEGTE